MSPTFQDLLARQLPALDIIMKNLDGASGIALQDALKFTDAADRIMENRYYKDWNYFWLCSNGKPFPNNENECSMTKACI